MNMEKEMNFDDLEMDSEIKAAVIMYDEHEELIQRLIVENLTNISIDYENKIFHAEYIGEGYNGISNGKIFDIAFYKMVIV